MSWWSRQGLIFRFVTCLCRPLQILPWTGKRVGAPFEEVGDAPYHVVPGAGTNMI